MLKVNLRYDGDTESPNENYGWKLISFNPRHQSYKNPDSLEFIIRDKVKTGHAYYLSYYEHGQVWWGLAGNTPPPGVEFRFDGFKLGGLLVWEGQEDPPEEESAEAFLKEYTDWANGECYAYEIFDEDDNLIDACGGFIGRDYVMEVIREATAGKESAIMNLNGV